MMLSDLLVNYADFLVAMSLALLGGFVRALHSRMQDRSWGFTAVMVVTAAFTGAITFLFLQDYRQSLPKGMLAAITGIAGFLGTDLLRVISLRMMAVVEKWDGHSDGDTTIISRKEPPE